MATYTGSNGSNTINGSSSADDIYGNGGNDTLNGLDGNDSLFGGTGNDSLTGGSGDDFLYGGIGTDLLYGGEGDDFLDGGDGNDQLYGGIGNDTLAGGAGADTLNGGQGMDYADYSASNAAVSVDLSSGSGTGVGGHAQGDVLTGIDGLIGSAFNDTLIGFDGFSTDPADAYTNIFYGGDGNDFLDGRGGDDELYGGNGADSVLGGAGNDTLGGGDGNDTLRGEDGNDNIFGDLGDDSLFGGNGNDTISGGDGNDLLQGDAGADALFGGAGADTLYGGAGADTLTGGAGADLMQGGADSDTFIVNVASDGFGDTIDGGETGLDSDTLDLTGAGPLRVEYDPGNPENGIVRFLAPDKSVIGTLTFTNIETVVPCFAAGTRLLTPTGPRMIETLRQAELVTTQDHGPQPVRWIGCRSLGPAELARAPHLRPVRIARGALGPDRPARDLTVSPQHRIVMSGYRAELLFGEDEVLVAARHLVGRPGITLSSADAVDYWHLMFDRHELVCSDGLWTESYQPGESTLAGMPDAQQAEIQALFPALRGTGAGVAYTAVRKSLRRHEAALLVA